MSRFLDMNTKFLKLHIFCSRTILVFMCNSSAYYSAPYLSASAPSTSFAMVTALPKTSPHLLPNFTLVRTTNALMELPI